MMHYFDNFRFTPVMPEAKKAWLNAIDKYHSLPHAPYPSALLAEQKVEGVRQNIADSLDTSAALLHFMGAFDKEYFSIFSQLISIQKHVKKPRILISEATSPQILAALNVIVENTDTQLIRIPIDTYGHWNKEILEKELDHKDVVLVIVEHTNYVLGTLQDIPTISQYVRKAEQLHGHTITLFCDAVYSYGKTPLSCRKYDVDVLYISGHTIGAPWGISVLYIRKSIQLFVPDDRQDIPCISALGAVVRKIFMHHNSISYNNAVLQYSISHMQELRNMLHTYIIQHIPDTVLNGPAIFENEKAVDVTRNPANLNITFRGIEGEALVLKLAFQECEVTTGSACSHTALIADHALLATGASYEDAHGSVRFTFGWQNTTEDIHTLTQVLPNICKELRIISSL